MTVIIQGQRGGSKHDEAGQTSKALQSPVLHRQLNWSPGKVVGGSGNFLCLEDGRKVFDASGGAAVSCLGHGNARVARTMMEQAMTGTPYVASLFWTTNSVEALCRELIDSTKGLMAKAYLVNSGSEAMESAMKFSRQYFLEKNPPEPERTRFIARHGSFHGTTLGALSMGGHKARRALFEPMLLGTVSHVSPCFAYRHQGSDSVDEYVARLAAELDQEFQRVGPHKVIAFVAEPVVGAALGCVPSVAGYFKAMKAVCDKYGALLILDEVMCGMGRTGTLHAWEQLGIVPDIQTIGKALGGGYAPIAGMLINHRLANVLRAGTGAFMHGHTYQAHPLCCAAALEVQRIIREQNLVDNVRRMGEVLSRMLAETLGNHPNVGNIRGRGLFWAIEFVVDKSTGRPFPPEDAVAMSVCVQGLTPEYAMAFYPATGTVNGKMGDFIIVSPPYTVTEEDIHLIVQTLTRLVSDFFAAKCMPA